MSTVAFDAAVDNGGFTSSSSRSWSHTVGAGTNRLLVVGCGFWNNGGSVSSVTYGGVNLTRGDQSGLSAGGSDRTELWYLINPTTGSATVAVTFSAAADGETFSVSLSTVDQTTPIRNHGSTTGSGTSASISATGAQTGDAIVDAAAWDDRNTAATMGAQTNRVQRANTSVAAGEGGAGSTLTSAPDPQTMNWTFGGVTRNWAIDYVVIANDGGGGGGFDPSTVPWQVQAPEVPTLALIGF
jgi:flagellin-like hook-associated protein FlgL